MGVYSDTGPFAIVPEWLLYSDVSDRALRVYAVLGRHADADGHSHPTRRRLWGLVGCSERSLDSAVRELVAAKALIVEHRRSENGDPTSNEWILLRAAPGGARNAPTGGAENAPTGGAGTDAQTRASLEREPIERDLAPAVRTRRQDPLFDAFVDCYAFDQSEITEHERGRLNKACKLLRDVSADPDEIPARRAMYAVLFRDAPQTPIALASHWAECNPDPDRLPFHASKTSAMVLRAAARARNEETP